MKKVLVCALVFAILCASGIASAACCGKAWDDLSWWCKGGATPAAVKDATRSGYWWWPKTPASNAGDAELWGNRGVVYGQCVADVVEPKVADEPKVVEPPKPKREVPVYNNVLFDFDKSDIRPDAAPIIDEVVAGMQANAKDTVLIEGHTCNVGEEAYNMGLGQRRADSIMKYMVDKGIDAGRVTTKSFGETQPAVSNDTPESRKLNRRGVFVITLGD